MPATYIDLTGLTFGRLSVLSLSKTCKGRCYWNCLCSCGKSVVTRGDGLKNGHAKSCGCLNREISSAKAYVSLVGQTFTRLTVIKRIPNNTKDVRYLCSCSCGNSSFAVLGASLKSGNTRSCGCLSTENKRRVVNTRNRDYRISKGQNPDVPMSTTTEQLRAEIRHSTLKFDVLKRDDFCCVLCKSKVKLQVHHIVPLNENFALNMEITNLISLCSDCHNTRAHPNKNTRIVDLSLQTIFLSYISNLF